MGKYQHWKFRQKGRDLNFQWYEHENNFNTRKGLYQRRVRWICCSVAKSCPTLCDPIDCSMPGSSVHGISQARILEWVAISFSKGSSRPRDWTRVSCFGRWILCHWATWETPLKYSGLLNSRRKRQTSNMDNSKKTRMASAGEQVCSGRNLT